MKKKMKMTLDAKNTQYASLSIYLTIVFSKVYWTCKVLRPVLMYFQRLLGLEYHFAFFADELWSVFCLILVFFIASGKRESHTVTIVSTCGFKNALTMLTQKI
jgi:hypothetical protein